jgi:class 3 adenylate cyclase/CHASE2 domain-containing sensor protein
MRRRDVIVAVLAALALSLTLASPLPLVGALQGVSLDSLFWLRYQAFGRLHPSAESPTAVIAVDEETWRSDEFRGDPEVLWLPRLGEVLRAVLAGGAKVIGFDVIYPTSMEKTLPGFEREYLRTLRAGASEGRIVLGKVQHQYLPIPPSPAQSFAVFNEKNIRSVMLATDSDNVSRGVPLTFDNEAIGGGLRVDPSLSVELAMRATGTTTKPVPGQPFALGDYVVPGSANNEILINFDQGNDIPSYPLIDLLECARKGEAGAAYFREHFAGKVVLIGYIQDVEDRKVASKRFIVGNEHFSNMPRCATTPNTDFLRDDLYRVAIPGVYIHAGAINSLLRHEVLSELEPPVRWLPGFVVSLVVALVALVVGPLGAAAAVGGAALAWTGAATVALEHAWSLPLYEVLLSAVLTVGLIIGYRFAVADRDKRNLRRSFSLYLAPEIVDRMIESDKAPELGGEERTISVYFSDVADFTTMSEGMPPKELVAVMNAYFTAMTDIVMAHGGYVDKYIGDAIVAVFGAPHSDPDHALHAVQAALACCAKLAELNADGTSFFGKHIGMRIGLNTGETLVGNIGSRRKFNYTVMGDTVNLASRLQD